MSDFTSVTMHLPLREHTHHVRVREWGRAWVRVRLMIRLGVRLGVGIAKYERFHQRNDAPSIERTHTSC